MNRTKNCISCNKSFLCPKQMGITKWNQRKYCSHKCYWKNKHDTPWNKGKTASTDSRILSDEKTYQWKGENVSYIGLHLWISRKLGKPSRCEHCNRTDGRFEWANKSRTYKRDLSDWIRLCYSCHEKYDKPWIKKQRDRLGRFL